MIVRTRSEKQKF